MALPSAIQVRILAGVALVTLCGTGRAEEPKDGAAADRVKVIRAMYGQVPPTILQLKEPIRLTQCAEQRVPVVIGLLFTDAEGTNHSFSWYLDNKKVQNREFDRLYWTRYKGSDPLGENMLALPVRGPEEVALYGVLLRWASAKEKAKDLSLFEQSMLKDVNSLLTRLDDRLGGEKPVPQKW
jgi:hypothetical protein